MECDCIGIWGVVGGVLIAHGIFIVIKVVVTVITK
jgi:hypothetical protein